MNTKLAFNNGFTKRAMEYGLNPKEAGKLLDSITNTVKDYYQKNPDVVHAGVGALAGGVGGALLAGEDDRMAGALVGAGMGGAAGYYGRDMMGMLQRRNKPAGVYDPAAMKQAIKDMEPSYDGAYNTPWDTTVGRGTYGEATVHPHQTKQYTERYY